ncbi:MAG: NADH:flavin oxidoreductase [Helicobacteraceae bacterium]|jgi:2,4-dienoyl-CoA reductase-like NADH-dependent reductase (Old Yellow Enzyme family)|nr:NADH:flavin oxidoreductase [Helicobacteraceae bacterium]
MKTLFDKTTLNGMTLKNRFIRAAIGDNASRSQIGKEILDRYEKIASGGAGVIITGFTLTNEIEKGYSAIPAFYNDSFFDGHKKLVDLVHSRDCAIVLQLAHIGSYSSVAFHKTAKRLVGKIRVLAPSAVQNAIAGILPEEITLDEINNAQNQFAQAALRAKNAGYNGVELHAAHGFFLSNFMSPYYNRRKDQYGGSTENRARMSLETYDRVRSAVGDDFPIWIKINVMDDYKIPLVFDDALYLCKKLTERGINAIEVSGAWRNFDERSAAYFKKEAEIIADQNDTALILTGGNRDFERMTEILNSTKIEYFAMARAFMKEPNIIDRFAREYNR